MAATTHLVHPGVILLEEFLQPMGITPYALAKAIGVDKSRVYAIATGRRDITPSTAARLARYFGTSDMFWVNLQSRYDLSKEHAAHECEIQAIEPLQAT